MHATKQGLVGTIEKATQQCITLLYQLLKLGCLVLPLFVLKTKHTATQMATSTCHAWIINNNMSHINKLINKSSIQCRIQDSNKFGCKRLSTWVWEDNFWTKLDRKTDTVNPVYSLWLWLLNTTFKYIVGFSYDLKIRLRLSAIINRKLTNTCKSVTII